MKTTTINKLQSEISKTIKEVEKGEVFEVLRYSEPVAYLVSKKQYENLLSNQNCKSCVSDLRKIADKINLDSK